MVVLNACIQEQLYNLTALGHKVPRETLNILIFPFGHAKLHLQSFITYLRIEFYQTLSFVHHIVITDLVSKWANFLSMLRCKFIGCSWKILLHTYTAFFRLLSPVQPVPLFRPAKDGSSAIFPKISTSWLIEPTTVHTSKCFQIFVILFHQGLQHHKAIHTQKPWKEEEESQHPSAVLMNMNTISPEFQDLLDLSLLIITSTTFNK